MLRSLNPQHYVINGRSVSMPTPRNVSRIVENTLTLRETVFRSYTETLTLPVAIEKTAIVRETSIITETLIEIKTIEELDIETLAIAVGLALEIELTARRR